MTPRAAPRQSEADRRRARLGLTILAGALLGLLSLPLTLRAFGDTGGFAASTVIVGLPTFIAMRPPGRSGRAALLDGAVVLLLGTGLFVAGWLFWIFSGL